MRMNAKQINIAVSAALALAVLAALNATYRWVFAPYAMQTTVRTEAERICAQSKTCLRVDDKLILNKDGQLHRRLVIVPTHNAKSRDLVEVRNEMTTVVTGLLAGFDGLTLKANIGSLPVEVDDAN